MTNGVAVYGLVISMFIIGFFAGGMIFADSINSSFKSFTGQKSTDKQLEEIKIDQLKYHWLESRVNCDQTQEIDSLKGIDSLIVNANHKLCTDIADGYVILAYRSYGVVFDQDVIDDFIAIHSGDNRTQ